MIREKYIAILEEKGEGFNQYLFWQNKANEIEAEERELRKEINDIKKDLKDFSEIIGKLFNKEEITSLAKCENYEDFLATDDYIEHLKNKINELIDEINNLKEKSNESINRKSK